MAINVCCYMLFGPCSNLCIHDVNSVNSNPKFKISFIFNVYLLWFFQIYHWVEGKHFLITLAKRWSISFDSLLIFVKWIGQGLTFSSLNFVRLICRISISLSETVNTSLVNRLQYWTVRSADFFCKLYWKFWMLYNPEMFLLIYISETLIWNFFYFKYNYGCNI